MADSDDDVSPAKVSAFAVYKNLIPGVKTYESTEPSPRSRKKKGRNWKNNTASPSSVIKQEVNLSSSDGGATTPKKKDTMPPEATMSPTSPKKRKKKNKKRKLSELGSHTTGDNKYQRMSSASDTAGPESSNSNVKKQKHKKKVQVIVSSSSETLEPPKKKKFLEIDKKVSQRQDLPQPQLNGDVSPTKRKGKTVTSPEMSWPESDDAEGRPSSRPSLRRIEHLFDSEPIEDSALFGKDVFEWMIHPMSTETFFSEHWEKKPFHLKRTTDRDRCAWLMSSAKLDEILRKNSIKFGKNIDITSYVDGQRETHNPEGRALPAVVWDFYNNGNSIRFLNPQTYIKNVWKLTTTLQEYFGSFVGANVYLTPPDSQGFAPHYDDIEGFVIQLEGFKQWKLYKPRKKEEQLPRFSSKNFDEVRDKIGAPIMDVTLGPGDMLYFPRGFIHQAKSIEGEHSLHITVSTFQTNSYYDFLNVYLPMALEQSAQENLELRRGLPLDYLSFMGIVNSDRTEKEIVEKRQAFQAKVKKLAEGVLRKSYDLAADQLGKKLVWDSLPPCFTSKENRRTVFSDGEFMTEGTVLNRVEMGPDVEVRLIRRHACRLLLEEGSLRLYFNLQNSKEYHGEEPAYIELPEQTGPAIEMLFKNYPGFTLVEDLPLDDAEMKVQLSADLWEKGILLTRNPLSAYPFDETMPSDSDDMEQDSESMSSEDVEDEEEEGEEDRDFIDDADEGSEGSVTYVSGEGEDDENEDEQSGSGGDVVVVDDFINDEASESDDNDKVEEPPRLVKLKQPLKGKKRIVK